MFLRWDLSSEKAGVTRASGLSAQETVSPHLSKERGQPASLAGLQVQRTQEKYPLTEKPYETVKNCYL